MGNIESDEEAFQRGKALWLDRLKTAELNLKLAQVHLHDAIANLRAGDLSVADELSPFREASKAEVDALRNYEHVLRIVRGLVEDGKIPDE